MIIILRGGINTENDLNLAKVNRHNASALWQFAYTLILQYGFAFIV
jgi:hypothetical protein